MPACGRRSREVLPEAAWQRCYVHFLRNALDHLPRKVDDDCLQELRWLYDRRDLAEARRDLAAWLAKWQAKYPKLTDWVEENIEETLTFYRLPRQHHKHLKSTNMLERLNEEIKRRTQVVRIFPNATSCLRLVRALAVETHENWLEAIATSTWTICASTRRPPSVLLGRRHDQLGLRKLRSSLRSLRTSRSPYDKWSSLLQFAELDRHNCHVFPPLAWPPGARRWRKRVVAPDLKASLNLLWYS